MKVLLLLTAVAATSGPIGETVISQTDTSGETAALSDVAKGKPVKLFFQSLFGEREFVHTPGLSNCNPDRFDVSEKARSEFEWLGADYSESIRYTPEERAQMEAAITFARAYNRTMFRVRHGDVLRICPAAIPNDQ